MTPSVDPRAREALERAQTAFQQGDRTGARDWAVQAARLDPTTEEPWLILAAVASPQASIQYLQRALQINPQSEQARQGLEWAAARQNLPGTSPLAPQLKPISARKVGDTQPLKTSTLKPPAAVGDTQPVKVVKSKAKTNTGEGRIRSAHPHPRAAGHPDLRCCHLFPGTPPAHRPRQPFLRFSPGRPSGKTHSHPHRHGHPHALAFTHPHPHPHRDANTHPHRNPGSHRHL